MLKDNDAMATVAVTDLAAARDFYGGKLGLNELASGNPDVMNFESGNSKILVYRSQYAGSNKATNVTWSVSDDLKLIVEALKANGVTFEHYDVPGLKLEGDIHVGDYLRVVWLKDRDGNILSILRRAGGG